MTSAAKFLLENSADASLKSDYGTTALIFASRRGNIDLVELLLEKNPECINVGDNSCVSKQTLLNHYFLFVFATQIAKKAVRRSVFLTIWHCILSGTL